MKHEFPAHIVAIAKNHNLTNEELNSIYAYLKDFTNPPSMRMVIHHKQLAGISSFNLRDVETIEFTEDQNQFLDSLLNNNPCDNLTEAIQWCINRCIEHNESNVIAKWWPSDLPPKDKAIVLGEDAEGVSYILQFLKGNSLRSCYNKGCDHDDHYDENSKDTTKCRSLEEGFYEMLEQSDDRGYLQKHREIIQWRSIPKSS